MHAMTCDFWSYRKHPHSISALEFTVYRLSSLHLSTHQVNIGQPF